VQSSEHVPSGPLEQGQALPGGSHSSPGSTWLFPQIATAGSQVARQQLPLPAMPPLAAHSAALDLVEQRSTTCGHVELSAQGVTPSSQTSPVHVPGTHRVHVTKPSFLPHVDRAAQRTTFPLQFVSSWPLVTASRTARATQLTYRPWFPLQGQAARIASRTVTRSGSLHPALAGVVKRTTPAANEKAKTIVLMRNPSLEWDCRLVVETCISRAATEPQYPQAPTREPPTPPGTTVHRGWTTTEPAFMETKGATGPIRGPTSCLVFVPD
jgi:hypothetical protein